MKNSVFNEEVFRKKLAFIFNNEISDDKSSLFSFQYNLSAETLVYILLWASNEYDFEINDKFIDSLSDYSFQNIVSSIASQVANS